MTRRLWWDRESGPIALWEILATWLVAGLGGFLLGLCF